MKKKELKKVIKKFTYKNKKSLCIFMVLAVLAGGVVIVKIRADKSKEIISTANYDRTVLIEKGEISNSINVNGKIESAEVSMVSTSLTEKVKSVNVKVGDYVKAGDVICTLDDGDITKEIEKKKAEIAENKKELEANYNKLSNQLTEARNVKIASVSAQDSIVSTLKSNYENIENDLNNKNNLININTASIQELDTLPGIGEATANKIVNYREEKGKFNSIEEIKNVNGIGDKKYEELKTLISIE